MGARSAENFSYINSVFLRKWQHAFYYCKAAFLCKIAAPFLKKILTDGRAQRGKFFHISIRFLCDAFYYCKTALVINIAPPLSLPPAILCVDKIGSRPRGNLCVDKIGSRPPEILCVDKIGSRPPDRQHTFKASQ